MFKIDANNDIIMSKGETVNITVPLYNQDGTSYTMADGDTIVFTMKNTLDENTTAFTTNTVGSNVIKIQHSDTADMEAGIYRYDILLKTASGGFFYINKPSLLNLLEVIST